MKNSVIGTRTVISHIVLYNIGEELSCYVHGLTATKNTGSSKYVTCQLQTENQMIKATCFSPDKIAPLRNAMNDKSPVKIKKFEYNDKFKNIVIKNNTTVSLSQEPLPFKPLDSLETHMVTIESLKMTSPQQLVNLKATVKGLSGSKTVKVERGNLTKSTATLVDPTGSTRAVFWEEWVDSVQNDKTYLFTNLRVKKDNYCGEIFVNTAKEGFKIQETTNFTENLAEIEPTLMEMTTEDTTISIIGVKTTSSYHACSACGKTTEQSGKLLKCNSCKLRQRVTPESKHWFVRVFAQDTNTNTNFYLNIFHQQLVTLFETKNKQLHAVLTEEDLGDILTEIDDLKITYNLADGKLLHVN